MHRLLPAIFSFIILTGCSLTSKLDKTPDEPVSTEVKSPSYIAFQNDYKNNQSITASQIAGSAPNNTGDLNFYVRGMMQQLIGNMQYVNSKTVMAVTSFVFLDGSFGQSDLVGQQLSESFIHEVHKYGIPIVDFKATDYIRITPNGDFVLTKDFEELEGNLPIKYVLTGTLVKQPTGYIVNARVIGINSKAVVATAQGKLPIAIVNSLISHNQIIL